MAREQQFVARDFMGLGSLGGSKEKGENKDSGMAVKVHEVDLGHLSGASASINNGIRFNSMAFAGLKHPLRSRTATFQQLLASGNLPEEKFVEQSAESTPERSYPSFSHPMQAWWQGDSSVRSVSTAGDEHASKTQIVGGFGGLLPKNTLSLPIPNLHTTTGFSEVPPSKPIEKKHSAPLTIFYGGNVNVFNDITAEKAQAIMLLASTGNLPGMVSADVSSGPINLAMTSATVPNTGAVNLAMASASGPNISTINLASCTQIDQKNCFQVENPQQVVTNQAHFGSANMQLDFGHASVPAPSSQEQPVVPTALPQARKASLARFLEKRRERVHSKSPYPLKQADSSLPEERFSSSNDIALCRPYSCNNEEKKKVSLPSWMERLPDYADTVVKEDTKIVSV